MWTHTHIFSTYTDQMNDSGITQGREFFTMLFQWSEQWFVESETATRKTLPSLELYGVMTI